MIRRDILAHIRRVVTGCAGCFGTSSGTNDRATSYGSGDLLEDERQYVQYPSRLTETCESTDYAYNLHITNDI